MLLLQPSKNLIPYIRTHTRTRRGPAFGNVFGGGRSQHSSNMFELLTQNNSVVETIKKPTPRRVHAYWVSTGEGRLTTFGDVFWGGRSQHSSDMFELLTQKSSVAETIKKPTRAPGSHTGCQQWRVVEEGKIGHSSGIFALFPYFLGVRYPKRPRDANPEL